ncbi:TPA: amino acid ABC transporter ATP-binding protein, partial [Escherichia coli]|nr:amino acid ABC transporter ATP-binding protein [Escherichia coli]
MEDLAKGGMTMIVVTHEMAFARKVANRVIYMNTGRVWETGTGDMLVRPETQELKEFLANGL